MSHHVFVYGTLRQGQHNHRLLATSPQVGRAFTFGKLVDLGSIPALVELGGADRVHGEVYIVSDKTLENLDRLEGYYGPDVMARNFYNRVSINAFIEGDTMAKSRECFTYYIPKRDDRTYNYIPTGDWVEYVKESR